MVATLVIHAITWIATQLPTPEGWKAELAFRSVAIQQRTCHFSLFPFFRVCQIAGGTLYFTNFISFYEPQNHTRTALAEEKRASDDRDEQGSICTNSCVFEHK